MTWSAESAPPRLALLPLDPTVRAVSDLLTAELSKNDRVALLERAQIDKVIAEQSLTRVNAGDYVKVGQLLGAQGLLILELGKEGDRELLTSRLVAVGPGVVLGLAQAPWPLEDLDGWTQLIVRQFGPRFPKLSVLSRDAVPISILNVRAAVQSRQAAPVEQALTTLLAHRLMQQPEIFVLERRQMETLGWEKELQAADASPFWSGSYLLEGTIDPEGFTKETLSLRLRLSPPKGGTPTVIDLAGPRTNLVSIANDAASRILTGLKQSGTAPEWKPEQEAERYFEEAKWALRWKLYREARVAAEASWALGRMNKGTATLRIQAWTAGAQQTLMRSFFDTMNRMRREPRARFEQAPLEPAVLLAVGRSLELFLEGSRTLLHGDASPDYAWYGLGVGALKVASDVLERYYDSPKERVGREDVLAQLRSLCREVSALYDDSPALRDDYVDIQRVRAFSGAYWQEDPADALELLRRCFRAPAGVPVRREFMLSRIEHGVPITTLIAWDPKDYQRLGSLWWALVDEMAASTNIGQRLDAGFLRLTETATGPELEASARRMFDLVLAERATVEHCAGEFDYRARTLSYLRFHCSYAIEPSSTRSIPPLPEHVRIMERWIPEFERKWDESKPKVATNAAPSTPAGVTSRLTTNALPTVVSCGTLARPTNFPPRVDSVTIVGRDGKTNVYAGTNRIPPRWAMTRPGLGRGPGFRPDDRPPEVKEVLAEEWVVDRFWSPRVPDELMAVLQTNALLYGGGPGRRIRTNTFQFSSLGVHGFKSRAAQVWVVVLTDRRRLGAQGFLCAVDPESVETRSFVFPWSWEWEFKEASDEAGFDRCAFDVLGNHVYVAAVGQIRRFDTRDRAWTEVGAPLQEVGRVTALGDRVFVTSNDSILEINPASLEVKVLASSRRRPALNSLDELDRLRFPLVWLAGERLRTLIQPWVYEYSVASNQWERVAYFEPYRGGGLVGEIRGGEWPVQAFGDGILVHHIPNVGFRRLLGLFGETRTPEALLNDNAYNPSMSSMMSRSLRQSSFVSTQKTNEARWTGPPRRKLVGASAHFDGTNLWSLSHVTRPGFGPGLFDFPKPGEHVALLLTRFAPGSSSVVTVPLKLRWDVPADRMRSQPRGPKYAQTELLATPAGFVVADRDFGGFWLLPEAELEKRIEAARASAGAIPPPNLTPAEPTPVPPR